MQHLIVVLKMEKRMKRIKSALIAVGLSLLLGGCGPIYKTTYTYRAPKGLRANKCANSCLWQRNRCKQRCQRTRQACEAQRNMLQTEADAVNNRCMMRRARRLRRHPGADVPECFASTPISNCNSNCNCLPDYNQCYSSCGGVVIPHRVCVAFCPKS